MAGRAGFEAVVDGMDTKAQLYQQDCIEGMLCAFQKSNSQCDVYNLGCKSFTTVTRIAQIVAGEMGLSDVKFKYTGGKRGWPGDAPVVHFDVGKMKKIGWEPRFDSDEAVRQATRRLLNKGG